MSTSGSKSTNNQNEINIDNLINRYNRLIAKVINVCDRVVPGNVDVERVRNLISLAKQTDPFYLLEKSKDKFWDVRDQIKTKNLAFFRNKNEPTLQKHILYENKENQEYIYQLMELIDDNLEKLSKKEMEYVWAIFQQMLECNIEYMIYTGDHE